MLTLYIHNSQDQSNTKLDVPAHCRQIGTPLHEAPPKAQTKINYGSILDRVSGNCDITKRFLQNSHCPHLQRSMAMWNYMRYLRKSSGFKGDGG